MSFETWLDLKRRHKAEIIAAVETALAKSGGNQSEAARLLEMDRPAMLRLMRDYGIGKPRPKATAWRWRFQEQEEGR